MAGRRSVHRVGSQRRSTSWLDIPIVGTNVAGGGAAILASLTAAELAKRPFTVVRTHLEVLYTSDQTAAQEVQLGAIGMCVVSDQANAIGVTAVPTPSTDLSSDLWFLHQVMMNEFLFATAVGFEDPSGRLFSIDSKAMRKVNDDQDVLIVAENTAASFGATYNIGGRLMIKEH